MESLSIDAKYWNFTHIEQFVWFARTFFISFARRGKRRTLYPACHPPVMMLCSTPGSFALWCVEMCSTGNSCQVDFSLIRFDPQLMYKYMYMVYTCLHSSRSETSKRFCLWSGATPWINSSSLPRTSFLNCAWTFLTHFDHLNFICQVMLIHIDHVHLWDYDSDNNLDEVALCQSNVSSTASLSSHIFSLFLSDLIDLCKLSLNLHFPCSLIVPCNCLVLSYGVSMKSSGTWGFLHWQVLVMRPGRRLK
jgi:hypothetical protein